MIWPHRSIKDDAAGSWSASRIVVIILNTNDRQKYVKTIMANFVTSGLKSEETFRIEDQSRKLLKIRNNNQIVKKINPKSA